MFSGPTMYLGTRWVALGRACVGVREWGKNMHYVALGSH